MIEHYQDKRFFLTNYSISGLRTYNVRLSLRFINKYQKPRVHTECISKEMKDIEDLKESVNEIFKVNMTYEKQEILDKIKELKQIIKNK